MMVVTIVTNIKILAIEIKFRDMAQFDEKAAY